MRNVICIATIILLLVACTDKEPVLEEVKELQELVETNSDIAEIKNEPNENEFLFVENIWDESKINGERLTINELENYPLFRPKVTEEELLSEGYTYEETSYGSGYSNDYVVYYFMDDINPYYMTVFGSNEFIAPREIEFGDSFEETINKFQQEFNWSQNENNLIYGKLRETDEEADSSLIQISI